MITVSIASMPDREYSLMRTIESIKKQCDKIQVYLNNYNNVPDFLINDKIVVYRSQDFGDLKDNGKFFKAEEIEGYHLTIDDDLRYSENYVKSMIEAIEKYKRLNIITCCGRIYNTPVRSYYAHAKKVINVGNNNIDTKVHIGGTGVMAYHTDTIKFSLNDFPKQCMTDIFASKKAYENNVEIICIAQPEGFIKHNLVNRLNSIYHKYNKNDSEQTEIINKLNFKFMENPLVNAIITTTGKPFQCTSFKFGVLKKKGVLRLMTPEEEAKYLNKPLVEAKLIEEKPTDPEHFNQMNELIEEKEEKIKVETKEEKTEIETKEEKSVNTKNKKGRKPKKS